MRIGSLSAAFGGAVLACAAVGSALAAPAVTKIAAPKPVDFVRDIQPLLSKNCYACHGPDAGQRKADLRLDARVDAIAKRGSRAGAIVPGHPEQSSLLQRVMDPVAARRMPPPGSGPALTPEQTAKIAAWIKQGAEYRVHWAFLPPKQSPLPKVKDASWPRNAMDRFVLAKLEANGLKPSPPADKYTLLRRASLDLRGLPPSPAEIDAFAADKSPDAYEKAVDRFFTDPAFGERWARLWLDLARYADSAGYGSDPLRPNMWRYRDWVIDAFNRNLTYDQFTIEQLAGDLLPSATVEQKMATAFHRNTMTNTEGGTDDEEWRVAAVKDRVDTTMQVWMGLTMGCAKCHTHKYDPIQQKEYYRFFDLFNQTEDNDRGDEAPLLNVPTPEIQARLADFEVKLAALKQRLTGLAAGDERKKLEAEIAAFEKTRPEVPNLPVMAELPADKHRKTFIMIKGNFLDKGEAVQAGFPAAFPPPSAEAPLSRLGVAKWLVDPKNPLTARVAVNRFWAQLFGIGIVETEEDFGTQGELPSNQALLDFLAVLFESPKSRVQSPRQPERPTVLGGAQPKGAPGAFGAAGPGASDASGFAWDMKALLRYLVTSATYRQSSRITPELLAKDPRNRWLGRAPRYRLEAEMIRDQALAVSGLMSKKIGGPSVFPPQPPGLWQAAFNGQRTWTTSTGEDKYRRGLYTFWRRTVPYPSMAAFDAPSREACTVRRSRTNTPLQAFVTMNDPVYVEAAQALGRRLIKEGGATVEARVTYGLKLATGRPASPAQIQSLTGLYRSELEHYRGKADEAKALATDPLGPLPDGVDPVEAAAWTVVGNVLLNLDALLTRS